MTYAGSKAGLSHPEILGGRATDGGEDKPVSIQGHASVSGSVRTLTVTQDSQDVERSEGSGVEGHARGYPPTDRANKETPRSAGSPARSGDGETVCGLGSLEAFNTGAGIKPGLPSLVSTTPPADVPPEGDPRRLLTDVAPSGEDVCWICCGDEMPACLHPRKPCDRCAVKLALEAE